MFDWLRNLFPYTNFHDLNADWIITTFREYVERIETALGGIGGYDSRLDAVEADNTRQDSEISGLDSEISGLDSRVTAAEAATATQATQISGLDTRVSATEDTNASQATLISGLDTRVTATETTNTTQATQISGLDSRVTAAEATNATQATQISGLDTRVSATENTNASQATLISGLYTRITALEYKNVVYTIPRDYAPGMEGPSITCNQAFAQITRAFPKINVRIDSTAPMVLGGCYQVCNLQPTLFQVDNNTYTAITFDFYGTRSDGTRGLMRLVHQADDTIVVTNIT